MADFFFRTEDIRVDEVSDYFVETRQDRDIIEQLKARNPVVLVGSRGVGKSFLFRMAEAELQVGFHRDRILPVYLTFRRSSLIHTSDPAQFHHWMLSRICHEITRALGKSGLLAVVPRGLSVLTGGPANATSQTTKNEQILKSFEESWQRPGVDVDVRTLPTTDEVLDAIEDLCHSLSIKRIVVFIDEAAHIFLPEQQRQFFTLYRDLRSPYLTCNAAVYPGVTVFGETFQPIHDATMLTLNRDIQDENYVSNMKEIVLKQAEDSSIIKNIARRGQNFAVLAYAASGNPRHLLKTVARVPQLDSENINEVVREYYRTDIWSEHSGLAEKYPGHRALVDWGRKFIESEVLPELQRKNVQYMQDEKKTTSFFWMHRDTPQSVKEAMRLLEYTGIVSEHATGIKATRSEIGTRFAVNLGCLMALESKPAATSFPIAKAVTPKRMSEYGANHKAYATLLDEVPTFAEPDTSTILKKQLDKSVDVLDITPWQREKLLFLKLTMVGDVLRASEGKLQEAYYVGEKRARRIRNAALAAVYEYLSG
jgi:hypothetical protein